MLDIERIGVSFPGFSLSSVSLKVEAGDYLALLGVSGAGKTLLLEILAGLVKPGEGRVLLHGRDITKSSIQKRGIGLVYQDLSLFPHMNVRKNIAFALKSRKLGRQESDKLIDSLAEETGSAHLLSRFPATLSGGEAQRVALARTLAADPDILLLDEPLANLDVSLKDGLRSLLRRIHQSGKTIIHVTHDYAEIATLANKVAIIEAGRLVQTGSPVEVFRKPESAFVARFSGVKNLFACTMEQDSNNSGLSCALLESGSRLFFSGKASAGRGYVMIPQHDILVSLHKLESSAVNCMEGEVAEIYQTGYGMELIVMAGEPYVVSISRQSCDMLGLIPGLQVWITFKASAVRFLSS